MTAQTYYHSLPDWCECFGIKLDYLKTDPENCYKITVKALEDWCSRHVNTGIRPKPRGLFLFNPTQTGGIYSADELSKIAHFIERHDLVVLADHVFAGTEFPHAPPAAFLAAESGMASRVVTVGGVSKSHNLANLRIGWACGPRETIEAMRRYSLSTIISVPRLNMVMALAALKADPQYLLKNASECAGRVEIIIDLIDVWNRETARSGLDKEIFRLVHVPLAGHSALISCSPLKGRRWSGGVITNSVDVTRFFLSEAKVAVSPAFSSGLDDCEVRICFGSVGLSGTYPHSADAEWLAVSGVLHARSSARNLTAMPQMMRMSGCDASSHQAKGEIFLEGRKLIRAAMIDRMLPAILKLMSGDIEEGCG